MICHLVVESHFTGFFFFKQAVYFLDERVPLFRVLLNSSSLFAQFKPGFFFSPIKVGSLGWRALSCNGYGCASSVQY